MAELNLIKSTFQSLSKSFNPVELMDLKELLLADDEMPTLDTHYELLKSREQDTLYFSVRTFFADRKNKPLVVDFLMKKFKGEKDFVTKSDIIQILGHMRAKEGLNLAEANFDNENSLIRYKSIIVLGWMGTEKNLSMLNTTLMKDADVKNRGFSATAMRQIWYNRPKTKDAILSYLKNALQKEQDEEALQMIIVTIQELVKKKLGLKESSRGEITGDVDSAKKKALITLETI